MVPYPVDEAAVCAMEERLGRRLPRLLRHRLMRDNGGEVAVLGDDWQLHPVWDPTDRRRMKRTTYHILRETEVARASERFPPDAISIAANDMGDRLVVRGGTDQVELWLHDTGETRPVSVIWTPYSPDIDDVDFEAILSLPNEDRYDYFIRRAAADGQIWGLADRGGWVTSSDGEGTEYMPVWPHPRFAAACAREEWGEATPTTIPLDEWLEGWTSQLIADGQHVSVFPNPAGASIGRRPEQLRDDLQDELASYEEDEDG